MKLAGIGFEVFVRTVQGFWGVVRGGSVGVLGFGVRGRVGGRSVGFGAGVPGSRVSGLGQCRVAAFGVSGLRESDFLFITVSHCAWRHVISLSKATKKRSKESAFNHATLSVHSVQF